MIHGNFKSKPGFIHPKTLDGVYFAPATYKSSHIEGRGRYWDSNTGIYSYNCKTIYGNVFAYHQQN